jgi:vibriolysin
VNAFWNGSQMVYGDGDGSTSAPLSRSFDVAAHELTHAVTSASSKLVYQNESGALNEAMSDIFAAICEARRDGGVSANTWKIGEEVWTPGTAGDALRYMNDPIADGQSKDYYPTRYTGSQDNGGVHLNSGIANLAFKLLVTGGTHPRSKTTINVPALGMEQAGKIFYRAQTTYFTSSTNFAAARTATANAANDLYGSDAKFAVESAWAAVGVGSAPSGGGGGGGGGGGEPTATALTSGVPVTISGAKDSFTYFSIVVPAGASSLSVTTAGSNGDADLFVKLGALPSNTSYDKKSDSSSSNETVSYTSPAAGTYYIAVQGYAAFSSLKVTATVSTSGGGGGGGGNVLQNGVPKTGLGGAQGSLVYFTIDAPANTPVKFTISGGTGDADLYVRFGAQPTTSTYDARPYLNGNNETATVTKATAGTYYVMLRGYSSYSGVSLTASY